jgi:hypothetical protein
VGRVLPPSDISRTKPLVRLVLNQIGRRLTEELRVGTRRHRLLLMLDEFPALDGSTSSSRQPESASRLPGNIQRQQFSVSANVVEVFPADAGIELITLVRRVSFDALARFISTVK